MRKQHPKCHHSSNSCCSLPSSPTVFADGVTKTSGKAMRAASERAPSNHCPSDISNVIGTIWALKMYMQLHTQLHYTLVNSDTFMVPKRSIILWKLPTIYMGNQAIAANKTPVAFCDYGWLEIKRRERGNDMHII